MLRLFLLRHAHAPKAEGQTDRERELDQKGYEEAEIVSSFLKDYKIDKVIASDAPRVKQTLSKLVNIPKPTFTSELYNAENHEILSLLKKSQPSISNLMIVGHNPGITSVIDLFNVEYKDTRQYSLTHNFNVTAKLVIVNFHSDNWNDADHAVAKIENLFYP